MRPRPGATFSDEDLIHVEAPDRDGGIAEDGPPSYAPNSEEEAVICARALAHVW